MSKYLIAIPKHYIIFDDVIQIIENNLITDATSIVEEIGPVLFESLTKEDIFNHIHENINPNDMKIYNVKNNIQINKSIDYIVILINNTWYILDTLFFNTTDIEDEGLFKNGFYNILLSGDNQFNDVKCYADIIWNDDKEYKEVIESINKYLG